MTDLWIDPKFVWLQLSSSKTWFSTTFPLWEWDGDPDLPRHLSFYSCLFIHNVIWRLLPIKKPGFYFSLDIWGTDCVVAVFFSEMLFCATSSIKQLSSAIYLQVHFKRTIPKGINLTYWHLPDMTDYLFSKFTVLLKHQTRRRRSTLMEARCGIWPLFSPTQIIILF